MSNFAADNTALHGHCKALEEAVPRAQSMLLDLASQHEDIIIRQPMAQRDKATESCKFVFSLVTCKFVFSLYVPRKLKLRVHTGVDGDVAHMSVPD